MIRFENYTINAGLSSTTFLNHKTGEVKTFPAGDPAGDFFDLMEEIENEWDAENESYSVVLDRLWAKLSK